MFELLWAKVWKWVAAIGALTAVAAGIFLKGRESGKQSQQVKVDQATQDAQVAKQTAQAVETRHDIDTQIEALPEAPPSSVAKPIPGSAVDELKSDGWVR